MTQPKQAKHKYRVSVYLGKDLYEKIDAVAQFMGVSVATMTKIFLSTGFELSKSVDSAMVDAFKVQQDVIKKGGQNNGE